MFFDGDTGWLREGISDALILRLVTQKRRHFRYDDQIWRGIKSLFDRREEQNSLIKLIQRPIFVCPFVCGEDQVALGLGWIALSSEAVLEQLSFAYIII